MLSWGVAPVVGRRRPVADARSNERDAIPPVLGDIIEDTLMGRRTTVEARHAEVQPALVEEDEPVGRVREPEALAVPAE
jgi:hypothetical protein